MSVWRYRFFLVVAVTAFLVGCNPENNPSEEPPQDGEPSGEEDSNKPDNDIDLQPYVPIPGQSLLSSARYKHCAIVNSERNVACWGNFQSGLAVLPPNPDSTTGDPIYVANTSSPFYLQDANGLAEGITDLAVGSSKICAIKNGTELQCWGHLRLNEANEGTPSFPVPISMGHFVTVPGLVEINDVATVGGICVAGKSNGELEHPDRVVCWAHGSGNPAALSGLGIGTFMGDTYYLDDVMSQFPEGVPLPAANGILSIDGGNGRYCAVLKTTPSNEAGDAVCWGDNYQSVLGYDHENDIGTFSTPLQAGFIDFDGYKVRKLALGMGVGCALLASQEPEDVYSSGVRCWGAPHLSGYTQFELESFKSESWANRFIIPGADQIYAIGRPLPVDVHLGYEDNPEGLALKARDLTAGTGQVCSIVQPYGDVDENNASVRCWGHNDSSNYYFRSDDVHYVPHSSDESENPMSAIHNLGDIPSLGDNEEFLEISAGQSNQCVLAVPAANTVQTVDAELGIKCWGYNYYGQLGNGTNDNVIDIPYEYSLTFPAPN